MGTGDTFEIPYRHFWELDHFKKLLPRQNGLRVLGVGCGAGRWGLSIGRDVACYTGIDVSVTQLDVARQAAQRAGLDNVTYLESSALTYYPKVGEYFDVISCEGILQYLKDGQVLQFLRNALSYLVPDGIIIDRSTLVREAVRYERKCSNYFCIYRTSEELVALFAKVGFIQTYQRRTYRYLRASSLWRCSLMRRFFLRGMRLFPTTTFSAMRSISIFLDLLQGEAGIEDDGHFYSHDFSVFVRGDRQK
jgi:2-polyprenyl-3-methyl-5-hydroxy-6-metoxy-1,4-benzoquinol methylase